MTKPKMTNEQMSDQIARAASDLNSAIRRACAAGLRVDLELSEGRSRADAMLLGGGEIGRAPSVNVIVYKIVQPE